VQAMMLRMEHHKLVLPEHLNHYGFLFGGYLLKWVDEVAWIAASLDYPSFKFVTVGMDRVEFHHSVHQGTILTFSADKTRVGNTSVRYDVDVWQGAPAPRQSVFSTVVTFVRIGEDGEKQALSAT
jgi:acyl-CoA hydrolase